MYSKAAQLISWVLHPLLLPTFTLAILLYVTPITILSIQNDARWLLVLVIFILTFLAPITGIMIFYTSGSVKNHDFQEVKDNKIPFIVVLVFYLLATLLFGINNTFNKLPFLLIFTGAITFCLLLTTLINFFWKISIHSVGIGGLLGCLFGLSYRFSDERFLYPIVIIITLSGILMSAQLYLNTHTPWQIFVGSILGFIINLIAMLYFL